MSHVVTFAMLAFFLLCAVAHWNTFKAGAWALMKKEKSEWGWRLWASLGIACMTWAWVACIAIRDVYGFLRMLIGWLF